MSAFGLLCVDSFIELKLTNRMNIEKPVVHYKVCKTCQAILPLDDFFKEHRTKDGFKLICKVCYTARCRAYDQRPERKAKAKANLKEKLKDPTFKSQLNARVLGYYHSNKQKWRTRANARYAIKTGKLVKQPCEVCSNPIVQAHHDDYSNPLKVRWLCQIHHAEIHRKKQSHNPL